MAYQDDYIRTALRLPRDLHAAIQLAAEAAGRSMNAEIIARLQAMEASDKKEREAIDQFMAMTDQAEAAQAKAVAAYETFTARMEGVERVLAELVAKVGHRS